jgi:uncharacterized protein YukE
MGNRKVPLMENNLLKAQSEEMNAFKGEVNSRIDKMQNDLKANGSAIAGFNNELNQINETISTSVGGNLTNDSEVIKRYVESAEKAEVGRQKAEDNRAESESETKDLYRYIIAGLMGLILKYELQVRKMNERLFAANEQDDDFKEKLIEKI